MILVYRPELESPPMDKECTIGFSFITGDSGNTDYINIKAGVTRDFPESVWERIKEYSVVKTLISLGALRIEITDSEEHETVALEGHDLNSITTIELQKALQLVEDSFDTEQLQRWYEKENRIKVRNSIQKRISAITTGNG